MVTVEEIQERIAELERLKKKSKIEDRYENSDEYLDKLIEVNQAMLRRLLN